MLSSPGKEKLVTNKQYNTVHKHPVRQQGIGHHKKTMHNSFTSTVTNWSSGIKAGNSSLME